MTDDGTQTPTNSDLDALAAALGGRARRDEPLAPYTSMRVGGPADLLFVSESVEDVVRAVALAGQHDIPWRVLGCGCNVLVADAGVRGLVIVNRTRAVTFDGLTVGAEAGARLAVLARETVKRGMTGLEWATGLPGTVGGAVAGNAGAFGGDVAGVLGSATVLEPDDGQTVERPNEWFEFVYRGSRIKRGSRGTEKQGSGRYVVLAATFGLERGDPEELAARADQILEWRRTHYPAGATAGSTFKNPPGDYAGRLIEEARLKGHRVGGAKISEQHANFVVNMGGATATDVMSLIERARAEVRQQFGVALELEIELVGW